MDDGTRATKHGKRWVTSALVVMLLVALGWGGVRLYDAMHPLEVAKRLLRADKGAKAIPYLERAIERDDSADAMRRLGNCYWEGCGVERNDEKAVQLRRKAAEKGDAESINWTRGGTGRRQGPGVLP